MLEELFNQVKNFASQNQTVPSLQKDDIAAEALIKWRLGGIWFQSRGLKSLVIMFSNSGLAGGAQHQQQRNGGGGLMDLIKGFIR